MANTMSRIARKRDAEWNGVGWSSTPRSAIREALEEEFGCAIPGTPTEEDVLRAGTKGSLVSTASVMRRISRKIEDDESMERAWLAYRANKLNKAGRIFVMAEIRSWVHHASDRLIASGVPQHDTRVTVDCAYASQLKSLAKHHHDKEGEKHLGSFIVAARNQGITSDPVRSFGASR